MFFYVINANLLSFNPVDSVCVSFDSPDKSERTGMPVIKNTKMLWLTLASLKFSSSDDIQPFLSVCFV